MTKTKNIGCCHKSYDQPREHIEKQRHYFANKVRLVKAMVFPAVMYGCESWTVKKAECCARFGSTYTKIGTIQRRLAWPLHKDDAQIREAFHIFDMEAT